MADMTPADVMALGNRGESFLEGNGIIILILFFLIFGWGNRNGADQAALTRAELSDGFNTSAIRDGIGALSRGQYDLNTGIMNNRYDAAIGIAGVDKSVMQSRYDTLLGQNALAAQIAQNRYDAALQAQNMQAQMADCCCQIKTAVHADAEATRDLIRQQTIDDLKNQLNIAQTSVANAVQTQNITQNILGNLGKFYANQPIGSYNGCGCA